MGGACDDITTHMQFMEAQFFTRTSLSEPEPRMHVASSGQYTC